MGLVITANHLEMVLVNLGYEIEHLKRVRLKFSPDIDYSVKIAGQVQQFLKECKTEKDILGIGIAIPGIIDQNEKTVLKSHALQVENYSLRFWNRHWDFRFILRMMLIPLCLRKIHKNITMRYTSP